jgi:hypothetical protein
MARKMADSVVVITGASSGIGRATKAMPPVYAPEQVARTIVRLAERPKHEVFVGIAVVHTAAGRRTAAGGWVRSGALG